jgi:hypothetical protein
MQSSMNLYDYQILAIKQLKNGNILNGGVGSGKSRTALAYYYFKILEGSIIVNNEGLNKKPINKVDLYIITTARKRDTKEWESEMVPFSLSTNSSKNPLGINIVIDSWNNIQHYKNSINSFFIFDEQRVVGKGAWVKAFLYICKHNNWILLSATPGDTWSDYIPVFIANGFYKNQTEFLREHAVYNRFTKYPKIDKYIYTGKLLAYRNKIMVNMNYIHNVVPHNITIFVQYNQMLYKSVNEKRWNIYTNAPIKQASELCYTLRRICNSDDSRAEEILKIIETHPKVIVFYSFDYELDILKSLCNSHKIIFSEWNGHKHEPIPSSTSWLYLVQYTAGAEGWNCILTDTIIFYSQNYSYKATVQAAGRIDRVNTPFTDLYYYHLRSGSGIDNAIRKALVSKKDFNESKYYSSFNSQK